MGVIAMPCGIVQLTSTMMLITVMAAKCFEYFKVMQMILLIHKGSSFKKSVWFTSHLRAFSPCTAHSRVIPLGHWYLHGHKSLQTIPRGERLQHQALWDVMTAFHLLRIPPWVNSFFKYILWTMLMTIIQNRPTMKLNQCSFLNRP